VGSPQTHFVYIQVCYDELKKKKKYNARALYSSDDI